MKLGINTYAYMWSIGFDGAWPEKPLSAMGLLEKTKELGLKVLQIGPNLPLNELPARELKAFIQQAREWNITLELGTRGLETSHLTQQVELAVKMGARLLRTVAEISGKPVGASEIVVHFRTIEPLLQKTGVKLALENSVIPATELREALVQARSDYLGIVLDTTNSLAVPEGWKYVTEILAPYVMCLHLKEFVIKRVWHMMGFVCEGMPAGKGQLDVPWLLKALKASRYDFNVIIEQWPPEQPELEKTIALEQTWAVESVQYLRKFIKD
jgi:sugar phosphate isomerase/epimerase